MPVQIAGRHNVADETPAAGVSRGVEPLPRGQAARDLRASSGGAWTGTMVGVGRRSRPSTRRSMPAGGRLSEMSGPATATPLPPVTLHRVTTPRFSSLIPGRCAGVT